MAESTEPEHVEPLAPAAPGQRNPLELAARVMSIVLVAWLCVMAVLSWLAYDEGYVGVVLPAWNSLFVLGTLPLIKGVFDRRLWAQRWIVGIAVYTALGNALQASRFGSTLLWFGAIVLAAVALTVRRARPLFNDSDGNRGTVQQLIATVVTVGSVIISVYAMGASGTERGRTAFASEVQQAYVKGGASTVHVRAESLDLVIESPTDTSEQIDSAAQNLHTSLATTGRRAKAWVVGFKHIIVTNGSYKRILAPDDPP